VNVRALIVLAALSLAGCSAAFEIARPPARLVPTPPAGGATVIEPDGAIIEETARPPIETVITGLSQAQQVRTLARQLAH
jgi:hypothetical protein